MGAAGGEEGGAADRGGRQPQPRVPAHPGPARVPLGLLQGGAGGRQRRHRREQGESDRFMVWCQLIIGWQTLRIFWSALRNHSSNVPYTSLAVRSGGRSPGPGRDGCPKDWGGVPTALVQRRQQHSHARLCLSANMG